MNFSTHLNNKSKCCTKAFCLIERVCADKVPRTFDSKLISKIQNPSANHSQRKTEAPVYSCK